MAGKKKSGKLPKHVLGVKIPKELRKVGGQLLETASSPAGREAIVGALAMAAAAATAAVARGRETSATGKPFAGPGEPVQGTQRDPAAFVDTLGQAAEAALGRLFGKTGG